MFFLTKDTIPEGVGFSTFGRTHLIWFILSHPEIIKVINTHKIIDNKFFIITPLKCFTYYIINFNYLQHKIQKIKRSQK